MKLKFLFLILVMTISLPLNAAFLWEKEYWDKEPQESWNQAIGYLILLKEDGTLSESVPLEKEDFILRSIGGSFGRINYKLINSKDVQSQAETIRDFEPVIAKAVEKGLLPLEYLWVNGIPEVVPHINCEEGIMLIQNTYQATAKFLIKLPSSFKGDTLWVGGERLLDQDNQDKFILNVTRSAKPDMLADASNAYHLMALPANKFKEIDFDHIGHTILVGPAIGKPLQEYQRILKTNGTLVFKTEHASKDYYEELIRKNIFSCIRQNMGIAGFRNIMIQLRQDQAFDPENPYYLNISAEK